MRLLESIAHFLGACYGTFKDTFRGYGKAEWIFCGVMGFALTGLFGTIYYRYAYKTEVRECHKVVSVGGCNRGGSCGVMLDNGQKTLSYMPVVGETICLTVLIDKE